MSTQLVGRATELARLVAETIDGAGAVMSGGAGVGKTVLADAVAKQVAATGSRVEWVVATETSRSIPFGALAPLLPDDINTLHPAVVLGAVIRRQRGLGPPRAGLIVVDDAHLLDDHSAAALLGLVTSGAGRVLITVRTGEVVPDAVRALWKDGFVARIDITPFDRAATQAFLESCLGGEVGTSTASMLWQHTRGNALFLGELVRRARADDRLVDEHGVWMWRGDLTVPSELADLLDRRFDGLGADGLDALGMLVLGEPLSLTVLSDLVGLDAIAELEARDVVQADERAGTVWYRFAHPMLAAAAARRVTPAHRRRLADALAGAPETGIDVVRRAIWQLDTSGPPDVELLLAGANAVFLTRPALALRLAERALSFDAGPRSALMVADSHAELGDVDLAREAQSRAAANAHTDADLLAVRLNQISLTAFSERRPNDALDLLEAAAIELPGAYRPELDSMAAQIAIFSARPVDALARAEQVLAGSPPRHCRIRASSVRVMALALVDRSAEAMACTDDLLADVIAGPTTPYAQGIAHIAAHLARFVYWAGQTAPATEPSGRWPVPPASSDPTAESESVSNPLFDGARRLLEGHADRAVAPLREAVAQQRIGEGLLRSEAVALLVVALAATGDTEEAERLLADVPPDDVAVYAGLRPWAESAVAAVGGRSEAVALAFEAFEEARAAGSPISAIAYLAAAARYGAVRPAAAALDELGHHFESPISQVRAMGIRARGNGDAKALLDAAERHAAVGLVSEALSLADLAVAGFGPDRAAPTRRAAELAREMRQRLRQPDTPTGSVVLTRRELEVATLAARGMTDRDIADVLVVSVRTVESHLSAVYRKLGIGSRRGLREALHRPTP